MAKELYSVRSGSGSLISTWPNQYTAMGAAREWYRRNERMMGVFVVYNPTGRIVLDRLPRHR